MKLIANQSFDEERALYGSENLLLKNCRFDGQADGESALKESHMIQAEHCFFNLRYPFWHNQNVKISDSEMTEFCRAGLWYSSGIVMKNSRIYGIKALRECQCVKLSDCDIVSPEFGWSVYDMTMQNCSVQSEYFMLRSANLNFQNVRLDGKYALQYIQDSVFENCHFQTKDAFWHAKNIFIRNSVIQGEYLAWYSENVVFENCRIIGTQPFCYCKGLRLINCEMLDADLCFEKSDVEAEIITPVISIKNPHSGYISVPSVTELIQDDATSSCKIILKNSV